LALSLTEASVEKLEKQYQILFEEKSFPGEQYEKPFSDEQ
jgi:hypothetical protein